MTIYDDIGHNLACCRDAIAEIDKMLRRFVCRRCGKPAGGVIGQGKSRAEAGLCTCLEPDVFEQREAVGPTSGIQGGET